ncbi:unnamed protein product [Pleuronectes platessa]|uniref:Uncharacterized protein n=1 Tax=Pleuronectes platessa TaxID=8262 RepID=A0A9N7YS28_PLEPL|nr:unnamed protein product [Pleuronectes platessa]
MNHRCKAPAPIISSSEVPLQEPEDRPGADNVSSDANGTEWITHLVLSGCSSRSDSAAAGFSSLFTSKDRTTTLDLDGALLRWMLCGGLPVAITFATATYWRK